MNTVHAWRCRDIRLLVAGGGGRGGDNGGAGGGGGAAGPEPSSKARLFLPVLSLREARVPV